jgi:hypothetical protein
MCFVKVLTMKIDYFPRQAFVTVIAYVHCLVQKARWTNRHCLRTFTAVQFSLSVTTLRLRLTLLILLSEVFNRCSVPVLSTADDQTGLRILVVRMPDKDVSVHITTSGDLSRYRIPPLSPLPPGKWLYI